MKLIAGSSNPQLAQHLAELLSLDIVPVELSKFANGEKRVRVMEDVSGEEVLVVQSFSNPVDEQIIEFLLITDALQRMGAKQVFAVIPWMGYSLQDKSFQLGEPIATKVVANLVSNGFVHRVYLLDLHNSSIPGFFSVPTLHLSANSLFSEYVRNNFDASNLVIASPDFGGLKRARTFANQLSAPMVNIDKHRDLNTGQVTAVGLHGDVDGKQVLLFDDIILSGGTAVETAKLLKDQGASDVHFLATHGVFANAAVEKLNHSPLTSIVITNSVETQETPHQTVTLDTSAVFADALKKWL